MKLVVALVVASGLLACGSSDDDSGGGSGPLDAGDAAPFEGIYQLTAYTENGAGCDAEGPSTIDTVGDPLFVIAGTEIFGYYLLQLVACADTADCQAKAQAVKTNQPYSGEYFLTLSEQLSSTQLRGLLAGGGTQESGMCVGRDYYDHLMVAADGFVRVETRLTLLNDGPPRDGLCWAEPLKQRQEAEDLPCAELTVLEGNKISDI